MGHYIGMSWGGVRNVLSFEFVTDILNAPISGSYCCLFKGIIYNNEKGVLFPNNTFTVDIPPLSVVKASLSLMRSLFVNQ